MGLFSKPKGAFKYMNFEYILALAFLCAFYAGGVFLMKYIPQTKLANILFSCLVFIPYVCLCTVVYMDVGFDDWNFQNTLPVANVSPFMFSLMPISLCLPKKIKPHFYLLISLLTVGMFFSSIFGCIYNAAINYKFHFHFMLDYMAHIFLSLFGVYLIRSNQVKLTLKNCMISGSILLGSATVMLILNLIFDTSFFGLSLRGKHNIYNNVLTDNSYVSALLYYVGVVAVLAMGFAVCKFFDREKWKIKETNK